MIECRVDVKPEKIEPDHDLSLTLFRILQEALTNVIRHAAATDVSVKLRDDGACVFLEIKDNGRGITSRSDSHKMLPKQGVKRDR